MRREWLQFSVQGGEPEGALGGAAGVRLVQEAYNTQAMGLYALLGFAVKEPLVRISGRPRSGPPANAEIRQLIAEDLEECERLCRRVHGITRADDLRDALRLFTPFACVRGGRITAYCYAVFAGILAWGVAETEEDMKALLLGIAAAVREPLAFHLPIRQAGFFRWCLDEGLRIEKPLKACDSEKACGGALRSKAHVSRMYLTRRTARQEGRYSASLTVTCKRLGRGDRSASSCHEPMPRRPAAKVP